MSTTSTGGWRRIVNFCSYIAIVFIALALLLARFIPSVASALTLVGNIIAYLVTASCGFFYARSKRHWGFIIVWLIAVIIIAVVMFP